MKKNLLLFAFSLLAISLNAQITITSADMPAPKKQFYQAIDTLPTISVGVAGTNQTWDMTALKDHRKDTLTVVLPSSTPYAATFPTANLAFTLAASANSFLNNTATSLTMVGAAVPAPLPFPFLLVLRFTKPDTIFAYPLTFGKTFTSNAQYYIKFKSPFPPVDSIDIKSTSVKKSVVDAWGTLKTPYGTFNTLRLMEKTIKRDSTFMLNGGVWAFQSVKIDSIKTYSWYANNVGFAIVSAAVDYKVDTIKTLTWLHTSLAVGFNEYTAKTAVNVYPNPAQNNIQFKLDANQATALQIYDIAGRMVYSTTITAELTTVNVSKFANGMYNYTIIGKENNRINNGKFIVAK